MDQSNDARRAGALGPPSPTITLQLAESAGPHRRVVTPARAHRVTRWMLAGVLGTFVVVYPFLQPQAAEVAGTAPTHVIEFVFAIIAGALGVALFWLEGRR